MTAPISLALETERRAQRTAALRGLLRRPLIRAQDQPELFAAIARQREWLSGWFADYAGWRLIVDVSAGFARLHKVPARLDPTRGARVAGRPAFDVRRYTLLALTLAALEDCSSQTTLARLATLVEEISRAEPGVPPFEAELRAERLALVDVLRLLVELGLLRQRDGDVDRYTASQEGDVLYDIETGLLSQMIAAPVPPALAASPAAMRAELYPETGDGERQRARHHAFRRLLEDPVVYYDELEAETREWLDHARSSLYARLEDDLGLQVERRKEGLAAVDPLGELSDTLFPDGGSTRNHAALLLAERLAGLHRGGEEVATGDNVVGMIAALQHEYGAACHWSKQYPVDPGGARSLAADVLELLEGFALVRREGDAWRIGAATARFTPATAQPSPHARPDTVAATSPGH